MDRTIVLCCMLAIGAVFVAIRFNQGDVNAGLFFLDPDTDEGSIYIDPGLCTPEVAPWGCWRVPDREDTMNTETFRNRVSYFNSGFENEELIDVFIKTSGKKLTLLWMLDNIGYYRENVFNGYHCQLRWTLHDDESATFVLRFRDGKEPGATCKKFEIGGKLTSGDHAMFDLEMTFPEPLGHVTPRYWLMSDHPDDYVLLFGCINPAQVRDGVCYGRWYVDFFVTSDPPDHPPMHFVVEELHRKLGLTLDNPGFRFLNIGHACPEE